ncbi:TetR/AcrR family transcriptional regulator [Nocardioides dubius]|uniref:HTH tetR-type domain-containing protein n=1 Tax=Nocardioides dubius TaxID=317019 RepID=A0ABP4EHW9_9ACTN
MSDAKPMSLREKRRAETREALIAAMATLLGRGDFQSTSIDQIAEEAGISRATFYAYFDSKEAILGAVVELMWREAEEIYARFGELADWSASSIGQWLNEFIDAWKLTAGRNRAASDAVRLELLGDVPDRYQGIVKIVRARTELWSRFTPREADARALMMVHMVQQMLTFHFMEDGERETDLLVEHLTSALRDLLRAEN